MDQTFIYNEPKASYKTKIAVLIAIGMLFANIPILLVLLEKFGRLQDFERIERFALAYEQSLDKEKYLAEVYDTLKHEDESKLPPRLMSFVVKVKVSQFGK